MNKPHKATAFTKATGIALMAAGTLLLAYVAVWATGTVIHWSFDIGIMFLIVCGALGVLAGVLLVNGFAVSWLRRHKAIRAALITAISLFLLSFMAVEGFVLYGAGLHQSTEAADFMMIPGASVVDDRPSLILRHRLDGAVPYLKANPNVIVIVSGGQGPGKEFTEAAVMKEYLVSNGIEEARVWEEDKAGNTIENLAYSKQIIEDMAPGRPYRLMIVTSDFHMFRAMLLARAQGLNTCGISVPVHWSVKPICYSREYFSVMKLLLTGMHAE